MKKKVMLYLKRSSPTILTYVGVVGVVATSVLTAKATTKARQLIEDEKEYLYVDELDKKEAFLIALPAYIPPVLMGVATISCIIGANSLNQKTQAALIGAYNMLDQAYGRYKEASIDIYGEDAPEKIKAEVARKTLIQASHFRRPVDVPDPDTEELLFFDSYQDRYFVSTMSHVLNAQYHVNRNLVLKGYVSMNDYYDFLGLSYVPGGGVVGWDIEELYSGGLSWLDFENLFVELEDGMECYIISAEVEPHLLNSEDTSHYQ